MGVNNNDQDSEPLDLDAPDDITSIFDALGSKVIKMALLLFMLFMFICSDVFIDRVLSNKEDTYVSGRAVTRKGIMAQGLILSMMYILFHILMECGYV
jgi:hypothetical protein